MVPGVIIDDARHPPKNATMKNFTSTDFLGPIKFDSPNGGTSISRTKKNVNSPFKSGAEATETEFKEKIMNVNDIKI